MLAYVKIILEKVSFDKTLFEKELKKGMNLLLPEEVKELKSWCYAHFGSMYRTVLNKIFKQQQSTLA
ncbi:MAG: hypothetical protein NWQ46_07030 [Spirosomaceae bacterium]|nr:hypothetical protein [Spirosomataceae bacterium]MDP5139052.1 hypothetical protein [Spirosomataceae bacterium]